MPTIRVRSRVAASDARALEAYLSEATKSVAHEVSSAVLSERTFTAEIAAIARCSAIKRPVLGLIVSWPAGVDVTTEQAIEATRLAIAMITGSDRLLSRIDAHGDAAHRHTHAAVLLIDPVTYRAPRLQLQRERLAEIHRAIGAHLGHNVGAVRTDNDRLSAGARDAEVWNGTMSFERWLMREVEVLQPTSWRVLDERLAAAGIRREPGAMRGQRFVDATTAKTYRARASKIGLGPTRISPWGPAPPPLAPSAVERDRPSYGELLQMRALPSPLLTAERAVLHERWRDERRTVRGTLSQFGAWLRRRANDTVTTNIPTKQPTRSNAVKQHTGGRIGDGRPVVVLSRDELLALLDRAYADVVHELALETRLAATGERLQREARLNAQRRRVALDDPVTTYSVPLERSGNPDPLAGLRRNRDQRDTGAGTIGPPGLETDLEAERRYTEMAEQYRHYLDMRVDSDKHAGDTVKAYHAGRAMAERGLQRNAQYYREAEGDGRSIASSKVADDLASLARLQERAALTLALYQTELRALAPISFAEFVKRERSLSEAQRDGILALAKDDRNPDRVFSNGFEYDEGLARLAHLEVVRKDDEIQFRSRTLGDRDDGELLFVERDGLFYVDRSNSSANVDAALAAAARLYDNKVTIEGDDRFVELALNRAVALGIDVTTPALRARYEQLKAAQSERIDTRDTLLPVWASAGMRQPREVERTDEIVGNLAVDGLQRLIAKSAFGEGATDVVDARALSQPLEGAYVTTVVVDEAPVVVSQDGDGRIVLSLLPASAEGREPREYGERIVVHAADDRPLEVVREREHGRDVTLAR